MTRKRTSAAAVSCVFLALAGCGSGVEAASGVPPPPSMLEVTCDAAQTKVSATTVAAQRDGLHVRVTDMTGLSATYLNYFYDGPDGGTLGGGDPVRAGTSSRVLQAPPGKVSLSCSYDEGVTRTKPANVNLRDPGHHFQATTLADLGCRPTGSPSWVYGDGRGKTADAAVEALLAKSPTPHQLHPRLAPIGYLAAATLTYLLDRDGHPWATATVTRDHRQYTANMDLLC